MTISKDVIKEPRHKKNRPESVTIAVREEGCTIVIRKFTRSNTIKLKNRSSGLWDSGV